MALDFPASPTNGQVYGSWIYSTAKGAWEAKPLEAMAATPSPTAPLTPQSGDMWYNTNDGGVYVYYNDGNTSQWVQMKSDATLSSTLGERTTTLENKLGLSRIIPPTVNYSGGSATANSLGTVSFTAVSSISLNNVFSDTYNSYRFIFDATSTALVDVYFRLRKNGADISTTDYFAAGISATYTNPSTGTLASDGQYGATMYRLGILGTLQGHSVVDIISPKISTRYTKFVSMNGSYHSNAIYYNKHQTGEYTINDSHDGFTLYPTSGTITGTVQVFGYNS